VAPPGNQAATANTHIDLESPGGRWRYKRKRSSSRGDARSRIGAKYSGMRPEQKVSDRDQVSRRRCIQKVQRRGKAPCLVEGGDVWRDGE
jgi:hypothetical protein